MAEDYFNYNNCSQGTTYTNHTNYCAVSGYNNHSNYYTNVSWNSYHANSGYNNYSDVRAHCHQNTRYTNHVNYSNPDTGVAQNLTWNSPWSGDTLSATYISESVDAIKQLRNNLKVLSDTKSQQTSLVDVDSVSPNVGDSQFDAGQTIEDNQYDALRESLNNLWQDIKGDDDSSTPGTIDKDFGDVVEKADWEFLKIKTDELAEYADPSYSNTVTCGTQTYANHTNYA